MLRAREESVDIDVIREVSLGFKGAEVTNHLLILSLMAYSSKQKSPLLSIHCINKPSSHQENSVGGGPPLRRN